MKAKEKENISNKNITNKRMVCIENIFCMYCIGIERNALYACPFLVNTLKKLFSKGNFYNIICTG